MTAKKTTRSPSKSMAASRAAVRARAAAAAADTPLALASIRAAIAETHATLKAVQGSQLVILRDFRRLLAEKELAVRMYVDIDRKARRLAAEARAKDALISNLEQQIRDHESRARLEAGR